MDWQRIKEKVTEEVLRQLQGDAGSATPEQVQQMVVSALSGAVAPAPAQVAPAAPAPGPGAGGLPACDVGPEFKTDLLVVVAGPVCDKVTAAIKALSAGHKVTVVTGTQSERLAEMQPCGQVVCGEGASESLARRLASGAQAVVVPVISTSVGAKVAGLIADCLPSAVLVQAALLGKRAVIARESMAVPKDAAWSIRRKVEEVVSNLRTLGFAVTDLDKLPAEVAKLTAAAGKGGYVPAYTPHPAVLASRAARAEAAAVALAPRGAAPAAPAGQAQPSYDNSLAKMIDHTLLKPEATAEQITKLCKEAVEYGFASVCINPTWVSLAAKLLHGTPVKVCTVIGFPLGATSTGAKAMEAADAIARGAAEVDMVLNVGALKSGQVDVVLNDIKSVVGASHPKALVKVILETGLLTAEEKVKACELAKQAGADFVKTSTGFGAGGATAEDIALMRNTVGPNLGVKASGGIRDWETATAMVKAGASRVGCSASINIVKGVKAAGGKDKY